MADFSPVGTHLPVRRDSLVDAKSAAPSARLDGDGDSIIAPQARDRMMELIEREQLPRDVNATLAGALSGDLQRQQLLFQAMIDTWPRLQKTLADQLGRLGKWDGETLHATDPDGSKRYTAPELKALWGPARARGIRHADPEGRARYMGRRADRGRARGWFRAAAVMGVAVIGWMTVGESVTAI